MSTRAERRAERRDEATSGRRSLVSGALVVLLVPGMIAGFILLRDDGGGDTTERDPARAQAPATTVTTSPATVATAPPTTTKAPFTYTIAESTVPDIQVFDSPEATTPTRSFQHPWHVNDDPNEPTVPLVFLVEEQRDDGWLRVLLPVRPNGSTGWVRASDVKTVETRFHVSVELAAHRITVYDGESVVLQEPVAIGKPDTPTPPGRYFIRVLLESGGATGPYGPFAYGLSAHSDVLTSFNGGDGEVGIHGNNDASVLGQSVSAGCVRMSNDGITRLTGMLPLGTPVEIVA